MNPFELALGIVLIVFIFRLLDNHFKRNAEAKQSEAPDGEDMLARVDAMEERIRVLEKIVTDDRYDLKREFKDLGS